MTRKPPTGARHSSCLTHAAHDYPKSGWLCITTRTDNVAWPESSYVPMPATDDTPAVVPIPRNIQPVDRVADMVAFADHLAAVAMAHRALELERRAIPAMTAADYAEPVDRLPDGRPVYRVVADHAAPGTGGVGLYTSRPQYPTAAQLAEPEPDTYAAAVARKAAEPVKTPRTRKARPTVVDYSAPMPDGFTVSDPFGALAEPEPVAPVVDPEPVPTAPDALTVCNGCGMAPADPDSPAGYCTDCERDAHAQPEPVQGCWYYLRTVGVPPIRCDAGLDGHDGEHHYPTPEPDTAPEPAPVSIAPAPVLAVLAPDGRPTCERCGQVFRKHGNGAEWHRVNRPDCAGTAARPSIAS